MSNQIKTITGYKIIRNGDKGKVEVVPVKETKRELSEKNTFSDSLSEMLANYRISVLRKSLRGKQRLIRET